MLGYNCNALFGRRALAVWLRDCKHKVLSDCKHKVLSDMYPQAFDMAYMLNGKYALKHDPTLTGRTTGKYL